MKRLLFVNALPLFFLGCTYNADRSVLKKLYSDAQDSLYFEPIHLSQDESNQIMNSTKFSIDYLLNADGVYN
ncbi:hypothetical protein MYP_1689 [Sporocytophaga myxococcoides]|uniref:Uncharacterized protein n=1 Tax=Sporocytophaga myxococcoides TaxID=153721 RepID=A0A098LC00_9BACT|nr:hypothetical protein MYP_1689 [Sporocytophaga myxococcoides]